MSGSISFDEIENQQGFLATGAKPESIDWLPEPPRQDRHVTLISVDDHLVEPPTCSSAGSRLASLIAPRGS